MPPLLFYLNCQSEDTMRNSKSNALCNLLFWILNNGIQNESKELYKKSSDHKVPLNFNKQAQKN